jgi:hypothetical protein
MQPLNRQDIPPAAGPAMWIVRLKANEKLHCTILSEHLWGIMVHWNGRNTEPCTGDELSCSGHQRKLPLRWKGYLHVWDHHKRTDKFLELTPTAARMLLDQVETEFPLRGQRVEIARMNGDNARLRVSVQARINEGFKLPDEKDPEETLRKLWGMADEKVLLGRSTAVSSGDEI